MKPLVVSSVVWIALLGAGRGSAQQPARSLLSPAEPTGDAGELSPLLASEPLRLSLTSTIFPMAGAFDACDTRGDASGNSTHGMPIQRFQFLRLAPQLVLHGFSSGGCPIDGGMGAGLTYATRLRPALWLVASAGYYAIPARGAALPARTSGDLRLDLVKTTDAGKTFRVGVEQKSGSGVSGAPAMVTFGMGF